MYFLFRETATEAMNCGKAVYSRIARVCKNDEGYNYLKVSRNTINYFSLKILHQDDQEFLFELFALLFVYRTKGKTNGLRF